MISSASSLRLSFKNVKKIANLQGFESLTTLCLDNNVLDKIGCISHLVNLKWLDLSFNNIRKIEGLETLTKLMDLSLFNNKIDKVQGLDTCLDLQCLSLGNNNISSLDGKELDSTTNEVGLCKYLRKFKSLHLVNLEGNPVCKEEEYKMMLLAFLPNIKYLDYALVHKTDVSTACERYQDELQEEEENEAIEVEKEKRDNDARRLAETLRAANLGVVQTLFDDFFKDDVEYGKLQHLPNINEHVDGLRNAMDQVAETFKLSGLSLEEDKRREIALFEAKVKDLRARDAETSVCVIEEFGRDKKRIFRDIDGSAANAKDAGPLVPKLEALYDKLMDLEIQQVCHFEDFISEFESLYGELKTQALDLQQTYFKGVEEAEETYLHAVTALANEYLEKSGKDELNHELFSEEATALLVDRDILLNMISSSHDVHVGKLFKADEDCKNREMAKFHGLVNAYQADATKRNRSRIMEMHTFVQENKKEIAMIMEEDVVDDDEYDDQ